ncbi:MAG: helix-turn-helix domain-containing protein [Planctomycetes bacterium]|nr:helix-turn-helix domain-containing protein [Planctomycetota bacterium]
MTATQSNLLTREQAGEYLGIRGQTLAAWSSTGRYAVPYIRVGRSIRYRREDLDDWLESRTVKPSKLNPVA